MNPYLRSILVLFVFLSVYEWLVHGFVLNELYSEYTQSWRSQPQTQLHWLIISHFLSAFFFCMLLSRSDSSILIDYLIFGAAVGLLAGAGRFVIYSLVPHSLLLTSLWALSELVKYSLCAAIFFFLNRQCSRRRGPNRV